MPSLLSLLGPEHNWGVQTSAGDFMKAIITVSANASQNEQTCIGPNELTRQLVSKRCVEQLTGYMLGGGNPLTVGVGIVIEVIRKNNSDYDPVVGAGPNSIPSSRDPIYLGILLRRFADHVPDFMNLIMSAPAQHQRLDSTFGTKLEPLGFDRFKTCELMAELLHCSNMGLLNEVGSEELIAARDAERQRLRKEGKLSPNRGEDTNTSSEGLAMREPHTEERRLEITNVSDDDGFEEVTHSNDLSEDTSHEFVKAEEEIPKVQASSTLGTDDDDFVDEPLSSPKPRHTILDSPMVDAGMIVAPLLSVKASAPPQRNVGGPVEDSTDRVERLSLGEKEGGSEAMDIDEKPVSDSDDPESPLIMTPTTTLPYPQSSIPPATPIPQPVTPVEGRKPTKETPETAAGPTDFKPAVPDAPAQQRLGDASTVVTHQSEHRALTPENPVTPVVGDYLKMQFVEYKVVPTILVCLLSHFVLFYLFKNFFMLFSRFQVAAAAILIFRTVILL